MSIDPLQRNPHTPLSSVQPLLAGNGEQGGAAFRALMGSLQGGAQAPPLKGELAADLLRLEMMQSTLSLSGAAEDSSRPSVTKPLESMLAAFAANRGTQPGTQPGGRIPAELPAPLQGGMPASASDTGAATPVRIEEIDKTAAQFLGTPYRFGGEGATGIDCSSFVQQVFREHRIDLPRTAREQSQMGSEVAQGDLQKGDLVFFQTYASYPSHVGIYLGDGKMIHASSGKGEVTISDINSGYYRSRYLGAKRIA